MGRIEQFSTIFHENLFKFSSCSDFPNSPSTIFPNTNPNKMKIQKKNSNLNENGINKKKLFFHFIFLSTNWKNRRKTNLNIQICTNEVLSHFKLFYSIWCQTVSISKWEKMEKFIFSKMFWNLNWNFLFHDTE